MEAAVIIWIVVALVCFVAFLYVLLWIPVEPLEPQLDDELLPQAIWEKQQK